MFETIGVWLSEKLLGGILGNLGGKRNRLADEKRHWAGEMIAIYTEGSHKNWRVLPRDEEHISRVANEVEGIDPKIANIFRLMVRRWSDIASEMDKRNKNISYSIKKFSIEDIKYYQKLTEEADKFGEEVLKVAYKWKK